MVACLLEYRYVAGGKLTVVTAGLEAHDGVSAEQFHGVAVLVKHVDRNYSPCVIP